MGTRVNSTRVEKLSPNEVHVRFEKAVDLEAAERLIDYLEVDAAVEANLFSDEFVHQRTNVVLVLRTNAAFYLSAAQTGLEHATQVSVGASSARDVALAEFDYDKDERTCR